MAEWHHSSRVVRDEAVEDKEAGKGEAALYLAAAKNQGEEKKWLAGSVRRSVVSDPRQSCVVEAPSAEERYCRYSSRFPRLQINQDPLCLCLFKRTIQLRTKWARIDRGEIESRF